MTTTAILTAAGSGQRLGADLPKALVPITGQPMVKLAAENLFASGAVDEIIVTVPDGYMNHFTNALDDIVQPITFVTGGKTRQGSITAALNQLTTDCDKVLVHDAARPLTPPALIAGVAYAVTKEVKAVIPALPVTDTIKQVVAQPNGLDSATPLHCAQNDRVSEQVEPGPEIYGLVVSTLDRSTLLAIQTPQGFDRVTLEKAYRNASDKGIQGTDDASLVEALNIPVKVIPGDPRAQKITTQIDLKTIEFLYGGR